jgi:hypothetical protein
MTLKEGHISGNLDSTWSLKSKTSWTFILDLLKCDFGDSTSSTALQRSNVINIRPNENNQDRRVEAVVAKVPQFYSSLQKRVALRTKSYITQP